MHMYVGRSFQGAVQYPNDERCAILLPAGTEMYVFFWLKTKKINDVYVFFIIVRVQKFG
jgi:hypothetical protein